MRTGLLALVSVAGLILVGAAVASVVVALRPHEESGAPVADVGGGAAGDSELVLSTGADAVDLVLSTVAAGAPHPADWPVGSSAPRTVTAPDDLSYESTALTQQTQESAAAAIEDVYVLDPRIRDQQVAEFDRIVAAIDGYRRSVTLPASARQSAIRAIPGTDFSQHTASTLLEVSDVRWQTMRTDAQDTLFRTLAGAVSPDDLAPARDRVSAFLSPLLTDDEANALEELLRPLIVPTVSVSQERTEGLRAEARANTPPVRVSYQAGDVIVAAGETVTEAVLEALEAAGMGSGLAILEEGYADAETDAARWTDPDTWLDRYERWRRSSAYQRTFVPDAGTVGAPPAAREVVTVRAEVYESSSTAREAFSAYRTEFTRQEAQHFVGPVIIATFGRMDDSVVGDERVTWAFSYVTGGQRVEVVAVLFRRANIIGSVGWEHAGGTLLRTEVDEAARRQDELILEAPRVRRE